MLNPPRGETGGERNGEGDGEGVEDPPAGLGEVPSGCRGGGAFEVDDGDGVIGGVAQQRDELTLAGFQDL